eukprot:2109046-Pyramimonas_sp.AAC.1
MWPGSGVLGTRRPLEDGKGCGVKGCGVAALHAHRNNDMGDSLRRHLRRTRPNPKQRRHRCSKWATARWE